jgi:hypothetical protein
MTGWWTGGQIIYLIKEPTWIMHDCKLFKYQCCLKKLYSNYFLYALLNLSRIRGWFSLLIIFMWCLL